MKKILALLLLTTLLLTACANPNPPIDGTSTSTTGENEITTPPDIEETTTPEKVETTTPEEDETDPPTYEERFAEVLQEYGYASIEDFEKNIYGKPLYPVTGSVNDLYVGMTLQEFSKIAFPDAFLAWHGYEFGTPYFYYWCDKDYNYVITVFNPDDTIREFKVFKNLKEDVTEEAILQITPGMHLYEIVELIGFPRYTGIAGNRPIGWGDKMYPLTFDWDTLILKANAFKEMKEYLSQQGTSVTTDSGSSMTDPVPIE